MYTGGAGGERDSFNQGADCHLYGPPAAGGLPSLCLWDGRAILCGSVGCAGHLLFGHCREVYALEERVRYVSLFLFPRLHYDDICGNDSEHDELRRFTRMDTTVKKDRKIIFVIALILGLVALYIVDMVILAWRL